MRNPAPPASAAATAIAAAPAVVMTVLLVDPARPTRTMPVLVTGPLPAAVAPGDGDMPCDMPDAVAPITKPPPAPIPLPIGEGDFAGVCV